MIGFVLIAGLYVWCSDLTWVLRLRRDLLAATTCLFITRPTIGARARILTFTARVYAMRAITIYHIAVISA